MENGFLFLKDANSLFKKLKHDYETFKADNKDQYKAYNFFVTAEHLPDWVGDTTIKDKNPYLRIASHLATGAKHFQVTNPKKDSVHSTAIDVYVVEGHTEEEYFETVLTLIITDKEAEELGINSIAVMNLADEVISFWSKHFESKKT